LPLSSRGIPLTQNKTKQNNDDKILPLFPNSQLFLSLSRALRIFAEKRTALKRETRREHAPPLNNISVPVVHHE
jgi:hypothetical protein